MHQSRGFRAARAAMFAATCVLLAGVGHVLMSGAMLPWWTLPMAFGWIGITAWILADRERGVPFVVVSTLVAQGALHLVFTLAQTMAPMGHMHGGTSYGMVGAHLAAAVLCGLWLAYGERAAFSVLRSLAVRVLLTLRLITIRHVTPPRITAAHSPGPLRELLLVHAITSRGPPRGVAV
ncbi:hypothetical protein ACQHIV_11095 [Kribbella sp. GL6]|uniref:hypothetical protein n=1 Tax=Kribbella sp. GL6 TaxID=3419765 RepID=UPI003D0349E7